jgi:hypothetical protein
MYLHIPINKTPHTNIDLSEESQDKSLHFAGYRSNAAKIEQVGGYQSA